MGGVTKQQVREIAAKARLPVARKRESMGVCFVGKKRSWADFISQYVTPRPGAAGCYFVVDEKAVVVFGLF